MPGGSAPSGNTTTVQKADPWTGQQGYLKQGFSGAQNLYQNHTPQYYPNNTNAPVNDWQSNSLQGIYNRGIQGSAVDANAQGAVQNYTNGSMLSDGNPYFQKMAQTIGNTVTPQVMSQFEGAGRYGSGAAANALSSTLSDKIGNLAYQNYDHGQDKQLQAAALSPQMSGTDFTNMDAALKAGGALQGQQQNQINADAGRYNYYQQLPQQQLQQYMQNIQGNYGSQSSTSSPYFTNPLASGLSGAMGLGSLGLGAYNSGLFSAGAGGANLSSSIAAAGIPAAAAGAAGMSSGEMAFLAAAGLPLGF